MNDQFEVYLGPFGRATYGRLGRPVGTHAHREGHLLFALNGAPGHVRFDQSRRRISEGEAVAVNPWESHAFEPSPDCDGKLLVLYIKPSWFLELGRSALGGLRFGRQMIEMTAPLRSAARKVAALFEGGGSTTAVDGALYALTRACFDQSWQWTPEAPSAATDAGSPSGLSGDFRVRKSIRLLSENFTSEIALDDVARASGLSRPHFYSLFRKHTGLTPHLFVNTLRMEHAIDGLTATEKSVTEIGFELGFGSQSGFTRFFAANTGMAPPAFRRASQHLSA